MPGIAGKTRHYWSGSSRPGSSAPSLSSNSRRRSQCHRPRYDLLSDRHGPNSKRTYLSSYAKTKTKSRQNQRVKKKANGSRNATRRRSSARKT